MATSQPPDPSPDQQVKIYSAYGSFKHNAAMTMLVLAPLLIAIPPRKLDLYTFSLTGAFVASANQLTVERTGKGLVSQFAYGGMPSRALEVQRQLAEQKQQQQQPRRLLEEKAAVPDEVLRRNTGVKGSIEERAKEVWMGGETEGWKERRLKEEQEKLDNGVGYADMIVDQIWEVWNWGEKKAEEIKEKDEQVVEQRKQEQHKKK